MDAFTASGTATATAAPPAVTRRPARTRFYVGLTLFMVAIVLTGFWPSYFGPMLRGNVARPLVIQLVWLSPVIAGMAYDWISRRRVHPAYVIGLVGLFVGSLRLLIEDSEVWLVIGRPLLDALRS